MKRFFALAALVLGLAACQTEPEGLDVNVGGEVDTTVCVSLPEATRANSAVGAFENLVSSQDYTIRYIFQVFYEGTESQAKRQVIYTDSEQVSFPVRLVPGRHYNFVVWADVTTTAGKELDTIHNLTIDEAAAADIHYDTENLKSVAIIDNSWVAMDETRDAFTGHYDTAVDGNGEMYSSASSINFTLTRPFAKLRVITTDMEQLNDLNITPTRATVEYTTEHYASFNAFAGDVNETGKMSKTHTNFEIKAYDDNVDDKSKVLFTDYFFAKDQQDVVNFTLKVYDQDGVIIGKETNFNTPIPAHRNNLTTISGNTLTEGNNITVTVEEDFAQPELEMDELSRVAMFEGGKYTLTEDVVLTSPLVVKQNMVLNLNGHTITADLKQEGRHHYAIDNYGTLTLEGEGAINARGIENFGTMTINGNITITNVDTNGGSTIWNEGNLVINGGTFTTNAMAGVGSYGGALYTTEDGHAVINGGNFIANSQLTYAILNYGETVINNATVKGKHGAVGSASGAAYKTTINGGSFELMENPGVSDHCAYYVSEIKGGKFTLGTNTDSGAQVFYASTIATGYKAIVKNGKYVVVAEEVDDVASTNEELTEALKDAQSGDTIYVATGEYTALTGVKDGLTIDATGAVFTGKSSVSGNGAKIIGATFRNNFNSDADNCLTGNLNNTTFENCVFEAYSSARYCYANGDIVFNNCKFGTPESWRGIHFDAGNGTVTFNDCDLYGFQAFGRALTKVTFNDCNFYNGRSTNVVNMYNVFEYNDCKFVADYHCDCADNGVVAAFNNCSYADNSDITKIVRFDKDKTTCIITFNGDTYVAEGLVQNNGTYRVLNAAGLSYFSDKSVADGTVIELIADIDFNGAEFKAIAAGYNKSLTFKGNNHTIKNVKLVTCSHNTVGAASLFFCYPGGTINVSDLVVEGATSEGAKYVGTILGYTQGNATLKNITVKDSEISGVKKIGGLVGFVEASTTSFIAENCHIVNTNVVATEKQAGTILGYNAKPATLKGCTVDALSTATAPAYCDGGVRCTDPAQAELTIE